MSTLEPHICRITGAMSCELGDVIQSLWSGYGVIQRVRLDLQGFPSAIVKHVDLSSVRTNRRGWGGDASHQRKVRSYQVEASFYQGFAESCDSSCRVPELIGIEELPEETGWLMVFEDLDAVGFSVRKDRVLNSDLQNCLGWLASFHATFLGDSPQRLWPIGTYWHLETRQEEWAAMTSSRLKRVAEKIGQRLNSCRYQTLVHGDAKVANFCFAELGRTPEVAALDFQYVGGGCGMKDVAYFISSCLDESESRRHQQALLDYYFEQLKMQLELREKRIDFEQLESEWRRMYPYAWADFCRFLDGWSPGHWKLNEYSDSITRQVISEME